MKKKIKKIELKNLVKFKLNKDEFTKQDLESIDEIILDSKNIIEKNKMKNLEINQKAKRLI